MCPARRRRRPRRRRGRGLVSWAKVASVSSPRAAFAGEAALEPPPHLVGERARALEVLAAGGLVCASALGLAEGAPPEEARPETIVLRVGDEPGAEALAERLALAGYERVPQAEERGQFAVRGGHRRRLPLHRPRAGAPRAFRRRGRVAPCVLAVHPAHAARAGRGDVYPAAERRADLVEPSLARRGRGGAGARRPRLAARRA